MPEPTDARAIFERLLASLDHPMLVVTASSADEWDGCLVGFATQVSIDPLRYAVGLSIRNRTYGLATGASHLGVHFLADDQLDLAARFGGLTADREPHRKLDDVAVHPGPHGTVLLDACEARMVGEIEARVPAGDHELFVLEPVSADVPPAAFAPLRFQQVRRLSPGHRP